MKFSVGLISAIAALVGLAAATPLPAGSRSPSPAPGSGRSTPDSIPSPVLPDNPTIAQMKANEQHQNSKVMITQQQYVEYYTKYFNHFDKYIFYTGDSEGQAEAFQAANHGYYRFHDLMDRSTWKKHFLTLNQPAVNYQDDADAASAAMAQVATGDVMVFGGVEWQTHPKAETSLWTTKEQGELHKRYGSGVTSIHHMIKNAKSPSEILAIETNTKTGDKYMFKWQGGHKEGETNAGK